MDYLRQRPKTGAYSYRRRVPDDLRKQVGKQEWKKSLKTKDRADAMLRCSSIANETTCTCSAAISTLASAL